jgi:hypothetical protein
MAKSPKCAIAFVLSVFSILSLVLLFARYSPAYAQTNMPEKTERYYVNLHPQKTGEHEIHAESCRYFKRMKRKKYLGSFSNCNQALKKALSLKIGQVDGCYFCCRKCHTR